MAKLQIVALRGGEWVCAAYREGGQTWTCKSFTLQFVSNAANHKSYAAATMPPWTVGDHWPPLVDDSRQVTLVVLFPRESLLFLMSCNRLFGNNAYIPKSCARFKR